MFGSMDSWPIGVSYSNFKTMKNILFAITVSFLFSCVQQTRPDDGWVISGFTKVDSLNPILIPNQNAIFTDPVTGNPVQWEERNVLNPAAIVKDGRVHLLYRAQDSAMTSRIAIAVSDDGLHFTRPAEPVFFPEEGKYLSLEWPGGVEDPRIVKNEDGRYLLTYTAYDGKTARLCLASSEDLISWERHGPVLADSVYQNTWSKSGAIVSRQQGDEIIATKINNYYWMYFGDTDLFIARSPDGIHWSPLVNNENGKMISVLHPRPGYFDSRLVEPGPLALIRDEGIVLIYNASNAANNNDSRLPRFAYAAGQALYKMDEPWKLLDRTNDYFIYPDKPYEMEGEVNQVCFVEGLVSFQGKWFLYYGTADSRIAVAVSDKL